MWYSGSLSGAVVFVIHSVSVLDAELAFTAQGSLYGETRALHHQTGSITVLRGISRPSPLLLVLQKACGDNHTHTYRLNGPARMRLTQIRDRTDNYEPLSEPVTCYFTIPIRIPPFLSHQTFSQQ